MSQEYKNYLQLTDVIEGNERREEMLSNITKNATLLPETITYKDIDEAFKSWVENELAITSNNGKEFPTMVLYSNQRFSEYTQSWKYTDLNNNLLLNFKTITRENNPQYGKIQNGYWNIPGDRFYTMKKEIVMDDNGSESFLIMKMKQPTAIDFIYKVSIFTTQYKSINEFNEMINKSFNSRQCYITPNNHYMPMTLESISDESSYNIDDRQFYGQTYQIKVMGYIITEDDYRVEEVPLKRGFLTPLMLNKKNYPEVVVEEYDNTGREKMIILFPSKTPKNSVTFTMDSDFIVSKIVSENIFNNYKIYLNDELLPQNILFSLKDGDSVRIIVSIQDKNKDGKIELFS